jgi:hypothetical protein
MQLGAKHVESPFIELGQISTVMYFAYFGLIVPILSISENTLIGINIDTSSKSIITLSSGKVPKGIRSFHATKRLLVDQQFVETVISAAATAYDASRDQFLEAIAQYNNLKAYIAQFGHTENASFLSDNNIPQTVKDNADEMFSKVADHSYEGEHLHSEGRKFLSYVHKEDPNNTVKTNISSKIINNNVVKKAFYNLPK